MSTDGTERPLENIVSCPSCNGDPVFSHNCLTCGGNGEVTKGIALLLQRTKPFPQQKIIVEGNPTIRGWMGDTGNNPYGPFD